MTGNAHRLATLALTLALCACGPGFDVSELDAAPERDSGEGDVGGDAREPVDASRADTSGGADAGTDVPVELPDAGSVDAGDYGSRFASAAPIGGCPMPQLLVGMNSEDNGLGRNGFIARYSIYPTVQRCSDLVGEGRIPARVDALGWLSPSTVVAAGSQLGAGVVAIDMATDTVLWDHEVDFETFPVRRVSDVFALVAPGGETYAGVSFSPLSGVLSRLRAYDRVGVVREWDLGGDTWPSDGEAYQIVQRPRQPGRILALTTLHSAEEIDIYTGTPRGPWVGESVVTNMDVYDDGLFVRGTWIQGDRRGLMYVDSSDGNGTVMPPFGPISCRGRGEPTHPCANPESLIVGISDPTKLGGFFAICEGPGVNVQHLVRFDRDEASSCDVVLNHGAVVRPQYAPRSLAIAVP